MASVVDPSNANCLPLEFAVPSCLFLISSTFQVTPSIPRSITGNRDMNLAVSRTSVNPHAPFVRAPRSIMSKIPCIQIVAHDSGTDFSSDEDEDEDEDDFVTYSRRPFAFDGSTNMTFYMSPFAISELVSGLCTRSRPACVIMNMGVPRWLEFDDMDWSKDSLRMLNTPNAGGSSLLSEVLSCEVLGRCLGARLAKTEMEIKYLFAYQPITDYTVTLPNVPPQMHVGVSVTRAFAFKGAYRKADCRKLLKKKLMGIQASTRNVLGERFFKQILHVWVPNGKVARTVQATYRSLPIEVTRNTVVLISVVNARWVFSNRR